MSHKAKHWLGSLAAIAVIFSACSGLPTPPSPPPSTSVPTVAPAATPPSSTPAPSTTDTSGEPIKIGFLYPFSGDNAVFGDWAKAGVNLRLDQASHTVAGHPIEIFMADENPLDPSATLLALKDLVQRDGIQLLIGPVFSSDEEAVAAYLQQVKIVSLIEETCPWDVAKYKVFACWPGTDTAATSFVGDYAAAQGYHKIATIGPDYVAGYNYLNGASDEFQRKGGTVVQKQWVPLTATDVGPFVSSIDPTADALVVWLLPSNEVAFLQEYKNRGLTAPILLEFGLYDPSFQDQGSQVLGMIGSSDYEPLAPGQANTDFWTAWKATYPDDLNPNEVQEGSWTMTDVALRALQATNGDASYGALWSAILGLHWNAPTGPSCFSQNGMALTTHFMTQAIKQGATYYWKPIASFPKVADPNDTGDC